MGAETVPIPSADGKIIFTDYWENGVIVGSCVTRTRACPPIGTHCTGRKTDLAEIVEVDCIGNPMPPTLLPGPAIEQ
jgi:hypothetical protein